ncbi:MAG: NAD-dependent epimerase/dehydratase family protein [Thermoproteales archaeon]|nr:NAD-dependent epimerase/dehydratase family protein [Thermoproteales archaeon]
MTIIITGGLGFIGSNLVKRLVNEKNIVILDNFSTGRLENLHPYENKRNIKVRKVDLRKMKELEDNIKEDIDTIFHFAANPEVRVGNPQEHLEHNIVATYNVLEVMRRKDIKKIVFASSSTVYGEATKLPTPEDYGPLKPISVYGASKLACEALISSYTHTYDLTGIALRYANVVGPNPTRGVVLDFYRKLKKNSSELEVLGDGKQTKSYIWITDAIEGTLTAWRNMHSGFEPFNVGSIDAIPVSRIAEIVIKEMKLDNVKIMYTGGVKGGRGWIGDVKNMYLDIKKLIALGWNPKYTSEEAIRLEIRSLMNQ